MSTRAALRNSREKAAANKAKVEALTEAANEPTRDELLAEAKALGVTGVSSAKKADIAAAITAAKAAPEVVPEPAVEATPEPTKPEPTNALDAAHEQCRAVKAWEQGGRKGDRPATPDYDAVLAANEAATAKKPSTKKAATSSGERRSKLGERGQAGAKVMREKGGTRGRGKKLTPDELVAYLVGVIKKHPDTTALDELYFAHWIEGIAVSKDRMNAAFDEAKNGAAKKAA